jgi:glycosyltransferase involved in cell wall biosynthesis
MSEILHPIFSIITPTYLRPPLLKRTIDSVRKQTFRDYEHIIVDDANDPETKKIVENLGDEKIRFHQHTYAKGAAGGYNTGIKMSKGKYILFLDDDDEYLPLFLEKMFIHFSQTAASVGFVWSGISVIKDTDSEEVVLYSKVWPSKFTTKEIGLVQATTLGNGFGVCVRKECIDFIGLFDESIAIGHDADFFFRLVRKYDFETIPEVLVKIHQHGISQLTNERNNLNRLELREIILKRHLDLLNLFPQLYYVHYKHVVDLSYNLNLRQKGRNAMLSIIKKSPYHVLSYLDLVFYEIVGSSLVDYYYKSLLRKIVHYLKGERDISWDLKQFLEYKTK